MSETAEAYLKSSAATGGVPLKSRFNMMIKENPLPMKVALAMIGPELEFLGPQLQVTTTLMFLLSCKAIGVGMTEADVEEHIFSTPLFLKFEQVIQTLSKKTNKIKLFVFISKQKIVIVVRYSTLCIAIHYTYSHPSYHSHHLNIFSHVYITDGLGVKFRNQK